jgi:hypothetical protein
MIVVAHLLTTGSANTLGNTARATVTAYDNNKWYTTVLYIIYKRADTAHP